MLECDNCNGSGYVPEDASRGLKRCEACAGTGERQDMNAYAARGAIRGAGIGFMVGGPAGVIPGAIVGFASWPVYLVRHLFRL